ncbi:MAG: MFS transporter [Chloroflexi bacterium]|nr:MFS transporter [Chloroflexota bacterium]
MAEQSLVVIGKNWKKPFFLVWTGQAFSLLGSQLVQFALIWYLTKQTGSATVLATATLVGMLPYIFLGPIAGSFVDRSNRRRIMILADIAIALATLLLVGLFALGWVQIWHIYALMLLRSLGQSFHSPAFAASTSLMVPKEHLARIQGINQMLNGGLNIVSAPLGALLLELLPMQAVLSVDIITALIAVASVLPVAIPQPRRELNGVDGKPIGFWADFREGFRYVLGWPGLLIVILMAALINFLLTPASALIPLLITEHFGKGVVQLGWFEGISGVGVIVGGLLLGAWGGFKKRIVTTMAGLVGLGLPFAFIGFLPPNGFMISLGLVLAAGFMIPIVNGSLDATMQATVDPSRQGRIFTLTGSLATGMTPMGLLIAGPLADLLGVQSWFIVGGLLCAAMGVAGFFIPSVMNIEAGRPEKHPPSVEIPQTGEVNKAV